MKNESELFKEKWMGWLLNFPIISPKKYSPEDLHKLKLEALFFCSPEFRFQNENSFKVLTPEQYKKRGSELNLKELRDALLPIAKFVWRFSNHPDDAERIRPLFSTYKKLTLNNVSMDLVVDPETLSFQIDYDSIDYLTRARMNLSKLIEGFPINSIIKCKGCSKYFIDTTLKKRKYCNSPCAARYISRKKREDIQLNPRRYKRYLKEQRERMRLRRMKER